MCSADIRVCRRAGAQVGRPVLHVRNMLLVQLLIRTYGMSCMTIVALVNYRLCHNIVGYAAAWNGTVRYAYHAARHCAVQYGMAWHGMS